jgi:hypothetical protein
MRSSGGEMITRLVTIASATFLFAASASASDFDRQVLSGALLGAGVGALAGGGVGAAIGGAAGGVAAFLIRPDGCYIQNRRGELWRVPCQGPVVRASACYIGNEIGGVRQVSCPARL